ncbi:hypothetical protein HEP84_49405 [Streptomyces sp. RLB1-33]|nr:hypothetical protein [Streptomyces sp. RLB1-33]QIY75826.1 hypothetical protein HEP84_49405 [Streptomyces sp. RLB1-33]
MSPRRRSSRTALLLATAFLLSSCGIPETGVVEAGEPATGIRPAQVLYFVGAGNLLAVRRHAFGPGGIETAVKTLFQGPDAQERRKGMTTDLPPLRAAPTVRTDGGRLSIELPGGTAPLTGAARAQLICTAAGARLVETPDADTAPTSVTVTVPGAWHTEGTSETCPSITGAE